MGQSTGKMQALSQLMGSWEITVKTFSGDSSSAQATPTSTAQGTATRSWLFDGKVLQEEIRCSPTRSASTGAGEDDGALGYTDPEEESDEQSTPPRTTPPSRPGTTPPGGSTPPSATPPRSGSSSGSSMTMGQAFQGHGMFGLDQKTGQFEHVWCDNTDSNLTLSSGNYDERTKTFTFNVKDAAGSSSGSARPSTPPTGGGMGGASDDDSPASGQSPSGQSQRPGSTTSSGSGSMNKVDMTGVERIVLRMSGETQHVVEYYKSGNNKIMEVTYSKAR
jgi:hypothetical protein